MKILIAIISDISFLFRQLRIIFMLNFIENSGLTGIKHNLKSKPSYYLKSLKKDDIIMAGN